MSKGLFGKALCIGYENCTRACGLAPTSYLYAPTSMKVSKFRLAHARSSKLLVPCRWYRREGGEKKGPATAAGTKTPPSPPHPPPGDQPAPPGRGSPAPPPAPPPPPPSPGAPPPRRT